MFFNGMFVTFLNREDFRRDFTKALYVLDLKCTECRLFGPIVILESLGFLVVRLLKIDCFKLEFFPVTFQYAHTVPVSNCN